MVVGSALIAVGAAATTTVYALEFIVPFTSTTVGEPFAAIGAVLLWVVLTFWSAK